MLQLQEWRNFDWWASFGQLRFSYDFALICQNSSPIRFVEDESKKNCPKWWRIDEEMLKKSDEDFWEFWEVLVKFSYRSLENVIVITILLGLETYTISLITLLIIISKNQLISENVHLGESPKMTLPNNAMWQLMTVQTSFSCHMWCVESSLASKFQVFWDFTMPCQKCT